MPEFYRVCLSTCSWEDGSQHESMFALVISEDLTTVEIGDFGTARPDGHSPCFVKITAEANERFDSPAQENPTESEWMTNMDGVMDAISGQWENLEPGFYIVGVHPRLFGQDDARTREALVITDRPGSADLIVSQTVYAWKEGPYRLTRDQWDSYTDMVMDKLYKEKGPWSA